MDVDINLIAVLVAAASSMVVGMVWYAKPVFGATWMKMAKLTEKDLQKNMPTSMTWAIGSAIIMAFVLAHLIVITHDYFGGSYLKDALQTGFWAWLGFSGLRLIMHGVFEQHPPKLPLIHAGNELATIMLMALIIGLFGN